MTEEDGYLKVAEQTDRIFRIYQTAFNEGDPRADHYAQQLGGVFNLEAIVPPQTLPGAAAKIHRSAKMVQHVPAIPAELADEAACHLFAAVQGLMKRDPDAVANLRQGLALLADHQDHPVVRNARVALDYLAKPRAARPASGVEELLQ